MNLLPRLYYTYGAKKQVITAPHTPSVCGLELLFWQKKGENELPQAAFI